MKQFLSLFLALLFCLSLVACSDKSDNSGQNTNETKEAVSDSTPADADTQSANTEKETETASTEEYPDRTIPVSSVSYTVKTPYTYPRYEEEGYEYFGAQHIQGACVSDDLKYMYFSLTGIIVKVDMETGEEVGKFIASRELQGKGFHMGNIAYHDGKLYTPIIFWGSPKTYIGVIDDADLVGTVDETKADFKPEDTILKALLTFNGLDENKLPDSGAPKYQTSGHDGITVGTIPGKGYINAKGEEITDDKTYLLVGLGTTLTDTIRYDDDNKQIVAYDFDGMTEDKLLPLTLARVNSEENENVYRYTYRMFLYTGDHRYGTQVICFDKDTGDILLFSYERAAANEFPDERTFVIDGSKKLYIDEIEVGQSVPKGTAAYNISKVVTYEYTDEDDFDGDGDTDEFPSGYHATLKCICGKGDIEKHEDVSFGDTGHKFKYCGAYFGSSNGVISVGNGYFYSVKASDNRPTNDDGTPKQYSSRNADIVEYGASGVLYSLTKNGKWDFKIVS